MSKGLTRSTSRGDVLQQKIVKDAIAVTDLAITVDGATGVGWGTAVAAGLPAGNIMLLGAVSYMQFTTASASVTDTFDGDYGIGTTPATDGTITAGDVDIVPSTALGAATAKVSPYARGVQADGSFAGVIFDNTAGTLELNLNVLIDDASISADGVAFTATGVIHIAYIMLGDD